MEPPSPGLSATRALSLLLLALVPLLTAAPSADQRKPFFIEDFVEGRFTTRTFQGTWVADNLLRFYNSTTRQVNLYDVETSSNNRTLVPSEVLTQFKDSSIDSYSRDGKLVAISFESEKIYRHSTKSKFVIYDTDSEKYYRVDNLLKLRTLVWAGDRSIIWVRDNNVYYRKDALTDGPDIAITSDGEEGVIFNGIPDWVYEEEVLASGSALWPSPDGSKLAFASFNDTKVNHTFYFEYGYSSKNNSVPQYPTVVNITYPKAGTPNPDVILRVIDLHHVAATGKVTLIPVPAPANVTKDNILYGCFWTSNRLLASWTNRAQNLNIISSCDMKGSCREALSQHEEAGWVDPPALKMHSAGRRAAAILPNDDRPHLAVVTFAEADDEKASVAFFTSGDITVLNILGWDEARGHLYYVQTQPDDPAMRHVYRVTVPGEDSNQVAPVPPTCLTCGVLTPEGNRCTYASATLSRNFTYGVVGCLGPDPAVYSLYRLQESPIALQRVWDDNAEVRALLATRRRPEIVDDWLPVAGGRFRARVRLLVPPGADRSGSTKYPLLVFVYAGPDSNQVTTAFSMQFGDYLSSSRKIVYALIDGRGSGRNGRTLMHAVYRHLGTVEIQDQIGVADQLKKKYRFVDPERTAIWGWSYGGFATAHAMAQDTQQVFCCGISVAPVTSFIYYDTIYTERYMGLPTAADNEAGYNGTDVSRNVANFRNKKYLLIHGNADDNVHYQQSMQLTRALEEADILFQQQSYPDEAHALSGVKRHVYHTMDDFWTRAFKLPKPEGSNRVRG